MFIHNPVPPLSWNDLLNFWPSIASSSHSWLLSTTPYNQLISSCKSQKTQRMSDAHGKCSRHIIRFCSYYIQYRYILKAKGRGVLFSMSFLVCQFWALSVFSFLLSVLPTWLIEMQISWTIKMPWQRYRDRWICNLPGGPAVAPPLLITLQGSL